MRRIDPAFPDLLPLSHRLGPVPVPEDGERAVLDPVEMRLLRASSPHPRAVGERTVPRRPIRVLVHAATAAHEGEMLAALVRAGCGVLVVVDAPLPPGRVPAPGFPGQVVAVAPWLPELWGGEALPALGGWRERGIEAGVLLGLGPAPGAAEQVQQAICEAVKQGAGFAVAVPLALPPEDRHRIYDRRAGEAGDGALENLLFHTDLGRLAAGLEREASRRCRSVGLAEVLPGPATSLVGCEVFRAATQLLLWARRLDVLEGVASAGWQLRRAAQALLASRRDPGPLLAEDNLRVLPGFNPWVEAFARSAWSGAGEPFEAVLAKWLAP